MNLFSFFQRTQFVVFYQTKLKVEKRIIYIQVRFKSGYIFHHYFFLNLFNSAWCSQFNSYNSFMCILIRTNKTLLRCLFVGLYATQTIFGIMENVKVNSKKSDRCNKKDLFKNRFSLKKMNLTTLYKFSLPIRIFWNPLFYTMPLFLLW